MIQAALEGLKIAGIVVVVGVIALPTLFVCAAIGVRFLNWLTDTLDRILFRRKP